MLKCSGLTKAYSKVLFENLDLELGAGEIAAITGPSGCGKTTLLRCICGLEELDSGKITLNDEDISLRRTEDRGIGLIFQKPVLYPHLDVGGNLRLAGGNIEKALSEVGLEGFSTRSIASLSGGEGQRVALARALLARPQILLLDEPFSSLDHELSLRLIEDVRTVLKLRNCSAILVTHNHEEATKFADTILDIF